MSNGESQSSDYLTFSQRYGYEPLPEPMKPGEISKDLRRNIWNSIRRLLWNTVRDKHGSSFPIHNRQFVERVVGSHLGKPEDEVAFPHYDGVERVFKPLIMDWTFNDLLDFIGIIVNDAFVSEEFTQQIKNLFERHSAAYRLDTSQKPYQFFPCTSKEQCDAIQQAIETLHDNGMNGAAKHLRDAGGHINKQEYADSIADSIHAVESVACVIDQKASKSLGPALDSLHKSGLLKHPALKEAFKKLYGYTCDEDGIRHARILKDNPNVGLDEALFMFGACASFAAYLVSKHQQAGQSEANTQ